MIKTLLLSTLALATTFTPMAAQAGATGLDRDGFAQYGKPALCKYNSTTGENNIKNVKVYTPMGQIFIGDDAWTVSQNPEFMAGRSEYPLAGRHTSGAPVLAMWGDGFIQVVHNQDGGHKLTITCNLV